MMKIKLSIYEPAELVLFHKQYMLKDYQILSDDGNDIEASAIRDEMYFVLWMATS